ARSGAAPPLGPGTAGGGRPAFGMEWAGRPPLPGARGVEHGVAEPPPGAADAVLAADARRVAEQLPGQVVGREIAADLTGPPGPVSPRLTRRPRRVAAQPRELGHRGLDAGGDVQHGAAGDVAFQGELQRPGDVLDVGVVTRCRAVAVDHDRLAG